MMEFSKDKTYGIFTTPQNQKIIAKMRESNASVIEFSYGEIIERDLSETETENLGNIAQFDWLVFGDVFSADFFIRKLEEIGLDLYELDEIRICSFGEAVADRFRFVQLHSDIIAQKIDETHIADSIVSYIGKSAELENTKILVVGFKSNVSQFADILRSKNSSVTELNLADFEPIKANGITIMKTMLAGGAVDDFIFCSVEDVMQFKLNFGNELLNEKIFDTVWGTDEITLKTLDEFGIKAFYLKK